MIHKSILLSCPPDVAFAIFTEKTGQWWPPDRRHTKDPESEIVMQRSGRFFERARDGREVELGRVRIWEPGARLTLDFYVGSDAEHPTEVTVRFAVEGEGTRVSIDHKPTEASAEVWNLRAAIFERSWDAVLHALDAACRR